MIKQTKPTKAKEIERNWHIVDAKGKILGRMATDIAKRLMGKNKPYFVSNLDCGDHVVVVNSKKVKVTGKKLTDKKYTNYSGYPGGLRVRTYKEVKETNPNEIIVRAVKGMLPKNKLRDRMLSRLHVFVDEEHSYSDKFSN